MTQRAFLTCCQHRASTHPHHHRSGLYFDAVSPALPSLPLGWQGRLLRVERGGLPIASLDPNDAALSKYARGEPRDRRWIQGGLLAGANSLAIVSQCFRGTHIFDAAASLRPAPDGSGQGLVR